MSNANKEPSCPHKALVTSALTGNRDALNALCKAIESPVYGLACRMLGDPTEACDQTQEIMLVAVTHLAEFRSESRFMTWVYTIASRHLLRTKVRQVRQVENLVDYINKGLAMTATSSQPEGLTSVLEREVRLGCTQAMLDLLSPEERLAVLLSEHLDADHNLGAEISACSPATFRKRLSRAKTKLEPVLKELCGVQTPSNPCSCARQVWAKQLAGIPTDTRFGATTHQAASQMSHIRRAAPLFAVDPPMAPPRELWREVVQGCHVLRLEGGAS